MSERCGEGRAGQARGDARLSRHPNVLNKNYSCKRQDAFKKDDSGLGPGGLGPTAPYKNQSVARSLAWPWGHAPSLAHTPHRQTDTRTHTHRPLEACPGSTPPHTPSCSHPGLPTPTRGPSAPGPASHPNTHPAGTPHTLFFSQLLWIPVASNGFSQKEKLRGAPGAAGAKWGGHTFNPGQWARDATHSTQTPQPSPPALETHQTLRCRSVCSQG